MILPSRMALTIFMTCRWGANDGWSVSISLSWSPSATSFAAHLLVLPFTGHEPALRLWPVGQGHDHLVALAREPLDRRLIVVEPSVRVFGTFESTDNVELLVTELDLLLQELVLGRGPTDDREVVCVCVRFTCCVSDPATRGSTHQLSGSSTVAKNLSNSSPLAGLMIFFPSTE